MSTFDKTYTFIMISNLQRKLYNKCYRCEKNLNKSIKNCRFFDEATSMQL